jgi:hypothetical protein
MLRSCLRPPFGILTGRKYATVSSSILASSRPEHIPAIPSELDKVLLTSLSAQLNGPPLRDLIQQYVERSGHILPSSLPYESLPTPQRRVTFDGGDSVVMIAHCACDHTGKHAVTVSSGFALAIPGDPDAGSFILTCAHTLEEARVRAGI